MLFGIRDHIIAYFVGASCTLISIGFSAHLIHKHLQNWTNPPQQRLIIAIILMVPLFAVDSCIGLFEMHASETLILFLDSIKECYEAVVISSFLSLMYLMVGIKEGGDPKKDDDATDSMQIPKSVLGRQIHQSFPFNYFMDDFEVNSQTLQQLHYWTIQFVYTRPILSVLMLYLTWNEQFDNTWYWTTTVILNSSVTMAVTALIMFYHSFEHELAPYQALAKCMWSI